MMTQQPDESDGDDGRDDDAPGLPREPFDALYEELHRQASSYMRRQPPGHTLQPTALVHEAWVKLYRRRPEDWTSEQHFLAAAATAMMSVLVDYARRKLREKRKAAGERVPLEAVLVHFQDQQVDVIDLQAALETLETEEDGRRMATIVRLRAFTGLTMQEIADYLRTPKRTVERDFAFARAWLHRALGLPPASGGTS